MSSEGSFQDCILAALSWLKYCLIADQACISESVLLVVRGGSAIFHGRVLYGRYAVCLREILPRTCANDIFVASFMESVLQVAKNSFDHASLCPASAQKISNQIHRRLAYAQLPVKLSKVDPGFAYVDCLRFKLMKRPPHPPEPLM